MGQIDKEVAVELNEEEQTPKHRRRSRPGTAIATTVALPDAEPHRVCRQWGVSE
jgi:hypothetical protein